ncbi:hypothetical protein Ahy_B09g100147 isoform B [Arachis hypogaea]|uniref:Uncharacterized protein n=1 Tax=Arachis hypogaea TaxID=3818 RepID=A0A444XVX9_ARAHY|nr:hypothetical protein Ahy_B09g100147 isoform B [Arachis hypogaea]
MELNIIEKLVPHCQEGLTLKKFNSWMEGDKDNPFPTYRKSNVDKFTVKGSLASTSILSFNSDVETTIFKYF